MNPRWIQIDTRIGYFEASESPLSADVGVIRGDSHTWLFDVGADPALLPLLQRRKRPFCLALSHFHPDHIQNWSQLAPDRLYQSAHTFRYTHSGDILRDDLYIEDGALIHLFSLPSSHAKGCLGMEVDHEYAFLGDAVYAMTKGGHPVYNANLLADEIAVLRSLQARYFLLSHDPVFLHTKEEVLEDLIRIYAMRSPQSMYIELPSDSE